MKKIVFKKLVNIFIVALFLCCVSVFLYGCTAESEKAEIALVTDIGQLMDAGFNQSTWDGVSTYAKNNNKTFQYYIPAHGADADDDDRANAMRDAIAHGAKIIVVPGFAQSRAITKVATEYPDIKIIYVDGWSVGLPNVSALIFHEEESGYLAGYSLVKDGYRSIGGVFGGGGTNAACNRYGYGFIQGARDAAKEENVTVELKYSYKYGETFTASDILEQLAEKWYRDGTEVIFACGGSMFYSVVTAAEKTDRGKVVGVDVDQAPFSSRVITSAIKKISVAVQKVLKSYYQNEWDTKLAYKEVKLGVADDVTGISYPSSKFKRFGIKQYDDTVNKIKNGDIKINIDLPADCGDGRWITYKGLNNRYIKIYFE